jgi:hypothetical protein
MNNFFYRLALVALVVQFSYTITAMHLKHEDTSSYEHSAFISKSEYEDTMSSMTLGILSIVSVEALLDDGDPIIDKQKISNLLAVDAADETARSRIFQGKQTLNEITNAINRGIRILFDKGKIPTAFVPVGGDGSSVDHYLLPSY